MSEPRYTDADVKLVEQLLLDGRSASAIAAELSRAMREFVSRSAVCGMIHRNKKLKAIAASKSGQRRTSPMTPAERVALRRALAKQRVVESEPNDIGRTPKSAGPPICRRASSCMRSMGPGSTETRSSMRPKA